MVNIFHIIEGTFKNIFHIFNKESLRRLTICSKCKDRKYIWGFGHYCGQCGCIIKSKITVKEERCPKCKW